MNVKVTRHNKRLDEHKLKSNLQQQSNNLSAKKTIGAASTRHQVYWCKKDHFQQSVLSRHVKSPIFIPVVELDKNVPKQKTN